jgi:uncharacterized small protein (DUF1192 family)
MSQLTLIGFTELSKRISELESYVETLAKVLADMERGKSE